MTEQKDNGIQADPVCCGGTDEWPGPVKDPVPVQAHWLACAVCRRGGCPSPPPGAEAIDALLDKMWAYPYLPIRVCADVEVVKGHFYDAYDNRPGRDTCTLPACFEDRQSEYVARMKDLSVCRILGIAPNTVLPVYWIYNVMFSRKSTLDGLCRTRSGGSDAWPKCPHADAGYYEKIAGERRVGLTAQTEQGEDMTGKGIWALIQPRTKKEMKSVKDGSANYILESADCLYIRPNHALCILCRADRDEPLVEDNLIELRKRMEADPDVPVTLTEGCCMVCDSCNIYDPVENICYGAHIKNPLRDLMILETLGLAPGATLPARDLYRLIYERIEDQRQICGWEDRLSTAPWWAPCASHDGNALVAARECGLITGQPVAYAGCPREEPADKQ